MDILLFVVQTAFILPIGIRMLDRQRSSPPPARELVAGVRQPGLLMHIVGLFLVWVGFGIAFWTTGLERSLTWQTGIANALGLLATALMASSFAVLRSWRFLARIDAGHELCTAGIYSVLRHPIYVAFDLLAIGVAVAVPSALVIAGAILLIAGGEIRARDEERVLVGAFGRRYQQYMRKVAARIPGVY